jgi:hypothetical protein
MTVVLLVSTASSSQRHLRSLLRVSRSQIPILRQRQLGIG